jgi:hypothetical protein
MRGSAWFFTIAIVGSCFAIPRPAQAWGKFGHLTVCDLAYRNLTDTSRAKVRALLRSEAGGITVPAHGKMPARHYTAFNLGCLEEDEIPRRNPDDHFINYSRDTAAVTSDTCPAAAAGGECILKGIRRDLASLKDETQPAKERVFALFAVGHWVGDIHQPLHVSFADDKGGNGIDATLAGKCGTSNYRPKNLHGIWDNCLLEAGMFERVRKRADYKNTWGPRTVTYRAVDTLLANTSLTDEKQIVQGEPFQWAEESYAITIEPDVHYCVAVSGSCNYSATAVTKPHNSKRLEAVDQAYLAKFEPVAQDRIRKAGFRLAHLLNQALDPAYTEPIQNSSQQP